MRTQLRSVSRPIRQLAMALVIGGLGMGCSVDDATRPTADATVAIAELVTETIQSDTTWMTTDLNVSPTRPIGPAQTVCISVRRGIPARCPPGAASYYALSGWRVDLSPIPGAYWIWAPRVDGETRPSELRTYRFSKDFIISGHPISGSLHIALDDYARVEVNGIVVGSAGSLTDIGEAVRAQNNLTTFDIGPTLRHGSNIIRITAHNGPAWFSSYCRATCSYQENPAGVVFGGTYSHTH